MSVQLSLRPSQSPAPLLRQGTHGSPIGTASRFHALTPTRGGSLQLPVMKTRTLSPEPPLRQSAPERFYSAQIPFSSAVRSQVQFDPAPSKIEFQQASAEEVRVLQNEGSTNRSAVSAGDDSQLLQQVQLLQQALFTQHTTSVNLETQINEILDKNARQQAEQAAFLSTLRDEIIVLQQQLMSLRETESPQEAVSRALTLNVEALQAEHRAAQQFTVAQLNNLDVEMQKFRVDVDEKIAQQDLQIKSWHSEVLQRFATCIEESFSQHASLITAVVSEVKSIKTSAGDNEGQLITTMTSRLAGSQNNSPQEQQQINADSVQQVEAEEEQTENSEALKKSKALLKKTQADLDSLRELLGKSITQGDHMLHQRCLERIKCLEVEEADLTEVCTLLRKQQLLDRQMEIAKEVQTTLHDDGLGAALQAVAGTRLGQFWTQQQQQESAKSLDLRTSEPNETAASLRPPPMALQPELVAQQFQAVLADPAFMAGTTPNGAVAQSGTVNGAVYQGNRAAPTQTANLANISGSGVGSYPSEIGSPMNKKLLQAMEEYR